MASYQLRLREHLGRYKREVLGVEVDGTWNYRRRIIPYPHILPAGQERLNIIEGSRDEFWTYFEDQKRHAERPATLHRDFAHLNSSQALAFNLFFPALGSSRAAPELLLEALGCRPEPVARWRFEEVLDRREGTNFDVAITFTSGRRVLVEVKLTESEFGVCADDHEHQQKLIDIYARRLAGKVTPGALTTPDFFSRYQILRNVSYANATTEVMFLVPKANEALDDGISFVKEAVSSAFQSSVHVVYLEDVLDRLTLLTSGSRLGGAVAELRRKYLLPS